MRKPLNYWTKERCLDVALKCENKKEFNIKYCGAYNASKRNEWYYEITQHMIPQGNLYKRLVYAYEFNDNYVYIGITCNEKKRHGDHLNGISPVHDHINETQVQPNKKILSNGYIDVEKARIFEKYWVDWYEDNGWHILNKNHIGALGSNILIWTKEKCAEVALNCNTRKEFSIKYISAYISSRKNKWLDDICNHMYFKRKPKDYWTYEKCKEAAAHCNSRFEFSHKYSHAYLTSTRNNWLNEFIPIQKK